MSAVDPALTAEVALRLSLVFEACTAMDSPTTGDKIKSRLLTTQVSKSDSAAGYSRSKDIDEDQSLASASRGILFPVYLLKIAYAEYLYNYLLNCLCY